MLRRFLRSSTGSRVLRTALVASAAVASIATFGGSSDWELHARSQNQAPLTLTSASTSFIDDFRAAGSATGANRLVFDGAVEVRTSQAPTAPIQVRVRFVPMGTSVASDETLVYATTRTAFTAVQGSIVCQSRMSCVTEGSFEVEILNPGDLGGATVDLHWVTTASLYGRGPAVPVDAVLRLTQP